MDAMGYVGLILGLVIFELAAWRWGVDSTDRPDSVEWERRGNWCAGRGRGSDRMVPEPWLWIATVERGRALRAEAARDRLAGRLSRPRLPLRALVASALRAAADRLDRPAPRVVGQQRQLAG